MAEKRPLAPRNELKPTVFVKERPELFRLDPAFHYEWFATDPKHPSYVGRVLSQEPIGDDRIGWTVAEPWEAVSDATDPAVKLLGIRDDQGKGIDTVRRRGAKVLMRTTHENAAKYRDKHDRVVDFMASRLTSMSSDHPGTRQRVSYDESAAPSDLVGRS